MTVRDDFSVLAEILPELRILRRKPEADHKLWHNDGMAFLPAFLKQRLAAWQEAWVDRLSSPDTLLLPSLLGLVVGVLSGAVIVLFRWLIESSQGVFLPDHGTESYELLHWGWRLGLPVLSGALIGVLYYWTLKGDYVVGILHVIVRLSYHQGQMSWRKFLMQFIGAGIAIIGGHSVGREAPSVHLGASTGALLGQHLQLPNNTVRALIGCGSAAAISASFNTPLAGVIFAMEVVMLEYTIASFLPIILASVSAASVTIFAFGNHSVFHIPPFELRSLGELPFIVLLGLLAGVVSTLQVKMTDSIAARSKEWSFVYKATLAGLVTGLIGLVYPQVLGIGYDSVNSAMLGEFGLLLLISILVAKLLATTTAIGLGVPGGVIGPTLFMGAMLGAAVGFTTVLVFPEQSSDAGFYALLGMGAMMAATLQAPLAALIAILELTNTSSVIFPGMLVIVIAELTRSEVFHQPSIFKALLTARGLDYSSNPLALALRRIGVANPMSKRFVTVVPELTREQAMALLQSEPQWILIEQGKAPSLALPAVALARYLEEHEEIETLDLLEIPADRQPIEGIHVRASLHEADRLLRKSGHAMLYVYDIPAPNFVRVKGILTRESIESAYRL